MDLCYFCYFFGFFDVMNDTHTDADNTYIQQIFLRSTFVIFFSGSVLYREYAHTREKKKEERERA